MHVEPTYFQKKSEFMFPSNTVIAAQYYLIEVNNLNEVVLSRDNRIGRTHKFRIFQMWIFRRFIHRNWAKIFPE